MRLSDFSYFLPPELIAQRPPEQRGDSRLLRLDGAEGALRDLAFRALPELLDPRDLLVFNDTRVMRARLFAHKPSGGRVEILIERLLGPREALVHLRASKSPRIGSELLLGEGVRLRVVGREEALFRLVSSETALTELMRSQGHVPLPPYIDRPDDGADLERYQTVFARREGAVAAPTAGLHFDQAMLDRLDGLGVARAGLTLHVGAGTFQPVRVERIEDHRMHAEWLEVDETLCRAVAGARARGGRVVAVGTTSARALESAAASGELIPYAGDSRLFITPGFRFRVVDALLTNFHLPESTLLMLVSAFSGRDNVLRAYAHAVAERYRFFSYGDAMFLTPSPGARAP